MPTKLVGNRRMPFFRTTFRSLTRYPTRDLLVLLAGPVLVVGLLGLVSRAATPATDRMQAGVAVTAQLQHRLHEIRLAAERRAEARQVAAAERAPRTWANVATRPTSETVARRESRPARKADRPRRITHRIKPNETLSTILGKEGLPPSQFTAWLSAAHKIDTFNDLQLGNAMTFAYEPDPSGMPTLRKVSYNIDKTSLLVLEKYDSGRIEPRVERLETRQVWRAVSGRITSSLYTAATGMGVPPRVIDEMVDMEWLVNFYGLHPGATFKVVFEEVQRNGEPVSLGRVLAAEIVNNGKTYTAFSLEPGRLDSNMAFVYPVRFTRISSVYRNARFHPVYKKKRPHRGVDFAAPPGTPVRAAATGRVTYAGWKGSYGRFVKIRHAGPYSTAYAHLRRIENGIRAGTLVKQGQTIGTVGTSGTATGPHLHFEMYKNGRFVDPLKERALANTAYAERTQSRTVPLSPKLAALKRRLEDCLATLTLDEQSGPLNRVYTATPAGSARGREAA